MQTVNTSIKATGIAFAKSFSNFVEQLGLTLGYDLFSVCVDTVAVIYFVLLFPTLGNVPSCRVNN